MAPLYLYYNYMVDNTPQTLPLVAIGEHANTGVALVNVRLGELLEYTWFLCTYTITIW